MATNNDTNLRAQGVSYYNGAGTFSGIEGSTSGYCLVSNGTGVAPSFQSINSRANVTNQTFTSSNTYTPTSNMKYCIVECIGAGGGGGGISASSTGTGAAGSCGGGGEYAVGIFTAAQIGSSQSVTVGTGGSGGTSGSTTGGNGGNTSLGSLISANGGTGGSGGAPATSALFAGGAGGSGGVWRILQSGRAAGRSRHRFFFRGHHRVLECAGRR